VETKQTTVQLDFYKESHDYYLSTFYLPEEQNQFSSLPMKAIERCKEEPERLPIVILADTIPVGFFILHHGKNILEYNDNPDVILIRSLSIDHKHQGKGYAKKGMALCPEFVKRHFPTINEIFLVVNDRNLAAQHLYKKVGFIDKGKRRVGPIGPQTLLHYPLA
jgi:RimJ/RimL family protein N-acetyltransferase